MAKRKPAATKVLDFGFTTRSDWDTKLLSTGIAPVDYVLGGGFGFGRAGELYGNYSSGKSYLLYLCLIQCQKMGGTAVLFEEEGAFHPGFFRMLGGDPDALIIPDADTVEEVFNYIKKNICPTAIKNPDHPICVGWDSIACTATKHLEDTGMDKIDMSKAKALSQGCSLIRDDLKKSNVALIACNQTRLKIGGYVPETVTPGGSGYPFLCSTRIQLTFDQGNSKSWITKKSEGTNTAKVPIGRWIRLRCEKNKLGPAMRGCSLPFYIEEGQEHPVYGYPTKIGIDVKEALWNFYFEEGHFKLPVTDPDAKPWEGPSVVESPQKGWYCLHESIDSTKKLFREADWPEKLEQFPQLATLPMQAQ